MESLGAPPEFGADWATPAPCTSTIAITASAPVNVSTEKSLQDGSAGIGRPDGMVPASRTRATLSAPTAMTTTVGRTSATIALTERIGVRRNTMIKPAAKIPVSNDASSIFPGMDEGIDCFGQVSRTRRWDAEKIRDLTEDDVGRDAGEEPVITEWETNLV